MFSNLILAITVFFSEAMAFAQATPGGKPSMIESIVPFVIMFGVIYFLMLRPQSKQRKEHAKFVAELKRGEIVVTAGGIIGKVDNINDKFVTIEVEDGAKMKVIRTYILSPMRPDEKNQPANTKN